MKITFKLLVTLMTLTSYKVFAKQYVINTQHSFINFEVDYMKVSIVKGSFDDFKGSFQLDEATNKVSALDMAISSRSINTRDIKRDKHLRQKDFFSIKKYPTIYFSGTSFKYSGGVLSEVSGPMELLGTIKPVTFYVDWRGFMKDPIDSSKKSLFLRAKTIINRQNFGLNWNRSLDSGGWIVGDKVNVDIVIEANPSDSRPAFSRFLKKNKKIINNPFDRLDSNSIKKESVLKPKAIVEESAVTSEGASQKKYSSNESRGVKSYILLVVGFLIFVGLLIGGGFLKKYLLDYLKKHCSERVAELISDFILYSVLLAAAIVSAPYMGYGDYFTK